jgi:hypothetical protein
MKYKFLIFCFFSFFVNAQEVKVEMISKLDNGDFGSKEFFLNSFEGINKVDYSFANNENIVGKDFKIIIRKYNKGKLEFEKIVVDTKAEEMPKIESEFHFSVFSKQTRGQQKIMIAFPTMRFFYRKTFELNKKFEDGIYDYRELVDDSNTGKKTFEFGKEIQLGLITPPNDNPKNGQLGYCEVTKSEIIIDEWYKKYQISEFFIIYLKIE